MTTSSTDLWFPTPESKTTEYWTRSPNDHEAVKEGCRFDWQSALHVAQFGERYVRHSVGQFFGKPFILAPWQWAEFVAPLYGWKRADGTRRYRRFGLYIPKKNGKSALGSFLSLYSLIADREHDAEVYSAAADKDQAKRIYSEAAKMVEKSPALRAKINIRNSVSTLFSKMDHSYFKALSADAETKDGLNAHVILFDELHTQKTRDLWRSLRYAGRARLQPIFGWITTAGKDVTRLWYDQLQYARKVASGEIIDTAFLPVIYEVPEDVDHSDETWWKKANPSMGITFSLPTMREEYKEAVNNGPNALAEFRQLMLNQIVRQGAGWLQPSWWRQGNVPEDKLPKPEGRVYSALDLGGTRDLNSFTIGWWADSGRRFVSKTWLWCPEENAKAVEIVNRDRYEAWVAKGHMKFTPGMWADWESIYRDVTQICKDYNVDVIVYDPHNAAQLIAKFIMDGKNLEIYRQNYLSYNMPCKEFERLLCSGGHIHPENDAMEWMIGNCVLVQDKAGYIMPDKAKSVDKIDGVVTNIMVLGIAMTDRPEGPSVYETKGFFD